MEHNDTSLIKNQYETPKYNDYQDTTNLDLTNKSMAEQITRNQIEEENAKLKTELHKLRKIQAGWFGRKRGKSVKNVYVNNTKIVNENHRLNETINNMKTQNTQLLGELKSLRD
jgi:hypothetical protein